MKFSYNWLRELSGAKKSAEKLAEDLMLHSFEIEAIEKLGEGLGKVVVGEILEIKKHPNADKLQLVAVDLGNKQLEIVCGAFNIKKGDKVPVALVGAKLPSGLEIKEAEIRGVKSKGMLCAADELGMGDDHTGILILDKEAKIGETLAKILKLDDSVLDVDVLPNRAHDALCHWGMAREICAAEKSKPNFGEENYSLAKYSKLKNDIGSIAIEIKDKDLCPRYIGVVLKDVKIGSSPDWIKARLAACGVKSINNVVDITNYVMLETGQPLHAFDLKEIPEGKIVVRKAKADEHITLLDEKEYKLTEEDLLITDGTNPLAVAGVMGGKGSGIKDDTKTIVLEAANFNALSIRKTKRRLNLDTESAYRYERELDPNLCETASARAVKLLEELAGAEVVSVNDVYPNAVKPWIINLDTNYVNKLLGVEIDIKDQVKILEALGFLVKKLNEPKQDWLNVEVPTRRLDVHYQEDLIEEIGRIWGYAKVPVTEPHATITLPAVNEEMIFTRDLQDILTSLGMDEVYNYSFYSLSDAQNAGLDTIKHWELANPVNPSLELARINLIPGLLNNTRENLKNFEQIKIFEIGRVYWLKEDNKPEEKKMLAGILARADRKEERKGELFFEVKGIVDELIGRLGVETIEYDSFEPTPKDSTMKLWHPTRLAEIRADGYEIGFVGEINPIVAGSFDIKGRAAAFEIDAEKLKRIASRDREYQPLRKFPTVTRDISLVVENKVLVEDILKTIQRAGGDLILDVDLFDIYEEIMDEPDKKSLAFHIIFGADDRTLESKEVDKLIKNINLDLKKSLGAKVRK